MEITIPNCLILPKLERKVPRLDISFHLYSVDPYHWNTHQKAAGKSTLNFRFRLNENIFFETDGYFYSNDDLSCKN